MDILVVQQLGKNISGTGMDTNVISRLMIPRQPEAFGNVDTGIITVLDLFGKMTGNIARLGLANVTTARMSRDRLVSTYTNAVPQASSGMFRTHLPIAWPTTSALQVAVAAALSRRRSHNGLHPRHAEPGTLLCQPQPASDRGRSPPPQDRRRSPHKASQMARCKTGRWSQRRFPPSGE
ncbi:MAG: hypothetical protein R2856_33340 [Caldilineaceae bacterium]